MRRSSLRARTSIPPRTIIVPESPKTAAARLPIAFASERAPTPVIGLATFRVPGPPEFADGLDDRIRLVGAARVPTAMGDGRAEAEPERSRRVCWLHVRPGWQRARWWLSLSESRSPATAPEPSRECCSFVEGEACGAGWPVTSNREWSLGGYVPVGERVDGS